MKSADNCRSCRRDSDGEQWSYSMSDDVPRGRINPPSLSQLEQLVAFMESKPELARGCARTANARVRSRRAWREIEEALNSEDGGCIKSWAEWSKYWKDKKGAVKRKASVIAAARARTGGVPDDSPSLSSAEQRIVAILGGDSFANGDVCVEIDPFQAAAGSATAGQGPADPLAEPPPAQSAGARSPRPGPAAEPRPQPDRTEDEMNSLYPETSAQSNTHQENSSGTLGASSGRELRATRRFAMRPQPRGTEYRSEWLRSRPGQPPRRLLHRPPPPQRHSHIACLTEKLIALEERRVDAELATARAHEAVARGQESIARGQENLLQAVRTLTEAVVNLIRK